MSIQAKSGRLTQMLCKIERGCVVVMLYVLRVRIQPKIKRKSIMAPSLPESSPGMQQLIV